MKTSLANALGETPRKLVEPARKMLAMRSEALCQKLAGQAQERITGRLIERAIELSGLTKQQASGHMGYADQSSLGKWISSIEKPDLDKLFQIPGFEMGLMLAMAERSNSAIRVRTVIEIDRRLA